MNNVVPILCLRDLKIPNNVNKGTIIISAPQPTKPANKPLKIPAVVIPNK